MKSCLLCLGLYFLVINLGQAQPMDEDDMDSKLMDDQMKMGRSASDFDTKKFPTEITKYTVHFNYEFFTPADYDNYRYEGINIGLQNNQRLENPEVYMIMGPNISYIGDVYQDNVEELIFLKWNHGIGKTYEVGNNKLLKPFVQAGVGYGWMNAKRDENAPLVEALAGVNFIPATDINIFAKLGYRFFNLDEAGSKSVGDMKGAFSMLGFGIGL